MRWLYKVRFSRFNPNKRSIYSLKVRTKDDWGAKKCYKQNKVGFQIAFLD